MTRLLILALVLTGCGAARKNAPATGVETATDAVYNQRLHDIWVLKKMLGKVEIHPEQRPRLELFPGERRMGGNGGCNELFGSMEATSEGIAFTGVGSTKMFCRDLMAQETAFVTALQAADRYEIKNLELLLYRGDELLMVLGKVD